MNTEIREKRDAGYFVNHRMTGVRWVVEGAFRYDVHLISLANYLRNFFPARQIGAVAGAPPCAWSLDMFEPRAPMTPHACASILASYAEEGLGVMLVFDNPVIEKETMRDAFAHWLIGEALRKENNPTGRNGVYTANDELARSLREKYGKNLRIVCHENRHLWGTEKRAGGYYARLGELYDAVMLHPRDAVNAGTVKDLPMHREYTAVLNDPTPRRYPARRELLSLAAQMRRNPYDYTLGENMRRLRARTGYYSDEDSCNLSQDEEDRLYNAGVREFVVQGNLLRNEITLWWDMFYHMLRTSEEDTNKAALVASAAMSVLRPAIDRVPSGLGLFGMVNELEG